MSSVPLLRRIRQLQGQMRTSVQRVGAGYRRQFHPDLSPAGWHLGHCTYTDDFWLHEIVLERGPVERDLKELYVSEDSPKPQRGERLPELPELLSWVNNRQQQNYRLLGSLPEHRHALLHKNYLLCFLLQHYAQHCETLCMVEAQCQHRRQDPPLTPALHVGIREPDMAPLTEGYYWIGTNHDACYDNERPRHRIWLQGTWISRRPVCNGEYLRFVEEGGYRQQRYWSEAGWRWRCRERPEAPEYWRQDNNGTWHTTVIPTPDRSANEAPVCGISYFEADAYARWAGYRLPHEYEWETATRLGLLGQRGQIWEWCANPLHPYPGFCAHPYKGYSVPYFDGQHYILRGGSHCTQAEIRRCSFRNYYPPQTRHLYAGLRLAGPLCA